MKDIIIIGTGKAGFLHYYSSKKFEKLGRIYFVDIDGKIKNENIVKKWKEIDLWAKEYIEKLIHKETKTLSEEKAKAKAIEIPINNKIYIPKTKVEYEEELERRRNLWG